LNEGFIDHEVVEGSFDADSFLRFINRLLNHMQPWPSPNSVIVMDSCQIHRHPAVLQAIKERGMRVEFLPACCPDYNPIELALSAMKDRLRRNGDYARLAMTELSDQDICFTLTSALYQTSFEDVFGWFRHCGYV